MGPVLEYRPLVVFVGECVDMNQPDPVLNELPHIVDLVMADMVERKRVGIERYGVALQAHNGRDALQDAYEEALDLTMYLRQAIEERGSVRRVKAWLPSDPG